MITVRMPRQLDLGQSASTTMAHAMGQYRYWREGEVEAHGRRTVMGFVLPDWQRGLVWTKAQKVSFIESAWLGIPIGTYSYNQTEINSPYDHLLIDGQQRMSAIQDYIEDEFAVFGCRYSELEKPDERRWAMMVSFPCYIANSQDEGWLKNYYNLTNFGGTSHKESERAS